MSVCLYVTGEPPETISANHGRFPEMFRRTRALATRTFEVVDGVGAPRLSPRQFSGLIVTGSPASVLDGEPWIDAAAELIERFADAGVPVLGVCFGHQLIAKAFGGGVRRAAVGLQSSSWSMHLTDDGARDPLFAGVPRRFSANLMHRDEITIACEDTIRVLAHGPHSIAAVAVGDSVRGVQFHPEFSAPETAAYVDLRADEIGEDAAVLRDRAEDTPDAEKTIANFLSEFVDRA